MMNLSTNGLNLIKSFEGCRLKAYKAVKTEKYYTIGYGHYGSDVTEGMTITQTKAEQLLLNDVYKFVGYVNDIVKAKYTNMNQNQFDALVSFTYNCGKSNLTKLTAKNTRTLTEISNALLSYNKSGGNVLVGLTKRRTAEKKLFDTPVASSKPVLAQPTLKAGSHGVQVRNLQEDLNYVLNAGLVLDGHMGSQTTAWLKVFQQKTKITADGIYGKTSQRKMLEQLNMR